MKANLATSLIAYARGGVRKQLLVLCLLTLCVGNMWGEDFTVYVTGEIFTGTGDNAWDNQKSVIKVDVRYQGNDDDFKDSDVYKDQEMTCTDYTYNGYPIYSYTFTPTWGGGQFRFKHYKNGVWKEDYTSNWHSVTEQIYRGYHNGHQWMVYGRDVTFYATPEKMDGSKWEEGTHSLFANFKYGDGESEWKRQQMTKTAYTYNGDAIYTCTMLLPYNVIKNVQFLYNDGSDHDLYVYTPSPQLTANDVDGKILLGWNGSHNWVSYGRDVTIYTIPDYLFKGFKTPYDESIHYPAVCIQMGSGTTWNTENLTKTAYTYESYPIYTGTILIDQNKFWEYQIKYFKKSDNTQVDLYQFNQYEPKTEYAPSYIDDKLYHGYNGKDHDFFSYRYDVALDMQSGGGGSPSIIAIDGSAMPSATMPGRDGYAFGGYWTETNGGGTQYYNADGSSTRNWDSRTITTLYAHWTPKPYTVKLEDMEPTTAGQGSVFVTFDASDNMTSAVTKPTKTHYDFGGYWTDNNDRGATLVKQLIDSTGAWIKDVSPYTGSDADGNPTWIYPNDISLFAKWEEHPYTIALVVSPEGAGTIDKGATIEAYYVTASDYIRAEPNTGYSFTEWDFSKTGEDNDVYSYSADGYTSTSNPIRVLAQHDGTLTAKFTANNYNVNLENLGADEGYKGTENVSVTYNSSVNLTENITIPQKAHYDFGGYWTEENGRGHQLIDSTGAWIASVDGYTDGDTNWLYTDSLTLYAKWTEHPYTVTTSVSPAGAGTLSCGSSVTAKWVTPSELITATANPAWKFVRWEYGENVELATGTELNNTVQINASVDGTLTAVFEPRFCLVGSIWDDSGNGGMPGWHDYDHTADFTVNSYTDLNTMNLTCVRSLDPNTTYKFEVHDKVNGKNLGYATPNTYIGDQSLLFNTQNQDVLLRVNGHGECTFTISALSDGDLYPTVSVAIPASHQLNLEWAYVRINGDWYKTSDTVGGTVSAQTTESGHHFDIHNGEYVAHGGDITYTATPATGYTFEGWYNNDYNTQFSTTNPYTSSNIQTTENVQAKFVEKATAVTLSNDGHGKVQIGGVDKTSTTCGVTTTRELTAVPNEGYKFSSWSKSGDDITLSSSSTNPTTLSGKGSGATSGQEVRANFIERWIVQPEVGEWGYEYFTIEHIEKVGGKTIGYVDITLEANTNYQFSVVDRDGDVKYKNGSDQVYFMTNGNSHNWPFTTDKTYNCGITTAGAGVYRFTWNITDKKMTVTYPNFIIYRTGDKAGDERATEDDVESYDGGTIEKAIEFRMRVNRLDKWYTLCLPFTVTAVKVWDEEDGAYYDIVPYWRPTDSTYYTGHYIIRTPVSTTDFAIENFDSQDRWVDPSSADGYLPSANTPYIIQWHDGYFSGKYISFFGPTGDSIPTSMNQGANTSSDETVNIYGNNCMTSGTVRDAYMLDSDYGSGGAWLRAEVGTDRTVLPFECFIRANATTTAKYRVLRRDMADDTPTGLDTLSKTEDTASKVLINNRIYIIRGGKIYTLQGTLVKEVE